MTLQYTPIYKTLFKNYGYTWEDIDKKIYPKILKEEGFPKQAIKVEMDYLNSKKWENKEHWK